jgi:hypothetical protein
MLLAQAPAELRGRVVDAESGDPLSGVDVAIGGFLTTTGRDGTFLFGSLDAGRYELRVRRVGYAPSERGVDVLPGLSQEIEIRLAARAVELDTITVMAASSAGLTASGEFLRRRGRNRVRRLMMGGASQTAVLAVPRSLRSAERRTRFPSCSTASGTSPSPGVPT